MAETSPLFDLDFVKRAYGFGGSDHDVRLRYLREAAPRLDPFHPLIEPEYLPSDTRDALSRGFFSRVEKDLLDPETTAHPWGPRFDASADLGPNETVGAALARVGAPIREAVVSHIAQRRTAPDAPIGTRWSDHLDPEDWARVAAAKDSRVAERVSIVIPTFQDHSMTIRAVDAVLASEPEADLEVIVVDNGSRLAVSRVLVARYVGEPRVRIVTEPLNLNFGTASNVGVAESTGATVLFLNNDTIAQPGWLAPMRERLEDPEVRGVQPLLIYPSGTVQTAGTLFAGRDALATHFLAGHPVEDAEKHDGAGFAAVTAAALLMRASEVIDLQGFDSVFVNGQEDVDLCLRAREAFGGWFAVEKRARIVHAESETPGRMARAMDNRRRFVARWGGRVPQRELHHFEAVGFAVPHVQPDVAGPLAIARPIIVRPARTTADGQSVLRWALRVNGWDRDRDLPERAAAIVEGLRAHGQEVVVEPSDAKLRQSAYLDDVVVTLDDPSPVVIAGRPNALVVAEGPAEPIAGVEVVRAGADASAAVDALIEWGFAHAHRP